MFDNPYGNIPYDDTMKSETWLAIVLVGLFLGLFLIMASLRPRPTPENPMLPDTILVEVPVPYAVHDTVVAASHNAKPLKHDTTIIRHTDTVYLRHGSPMFYVESDTVRQDSSWFMARYYLDPVDEFRFSYHIHERLVMKEVEIPGIQFKSGLGLSAYAGYGYCVKAKKFDWQFGVGISFGW